MVYKSVLLALLMLSACSKNYVHQKGHSSMDDHFSPHVDVRGNYIKNQCDSHLARALEHRNRLLEWDNYNDSLGLLQAYNNILVELDGAFSIASLLSQVHPDKNVRDHAEQCEKDATKFQTDLSLNRNIYNTLTNIKTARLDDDARRMYEKTIRDFKRSGVDKDDRTRAKIAKLKEELVEIGQRFGENIRKQRFTIEVSKNDLDGLPEDYIASHKPNSKGKIEISTDYPDYISFMKYAKNEDARKRLSYLYMNRGNENDEVLKRMIEKRHELAKTLGYSSYADYVVEDKMIKNAKSIHSFIDKISTIAKTGADKEYTTLLNYKKKYDRDAKEIYSYESGYLQEGLKKEIFKFDSKETRPYFNYNSVRDGLIDLTSELFGLRYVPVANAPIWHESVQAYDVFDEKGKLGRIYLDMHPRDGKYKHAAQFTIKSGLKGRQYAEGALVCNFPNPNEGQGLMDHDEVVTFFHEFGHLLHHVFASRHDWIPFSGTATEWDFVEAPSQLFEEWAWSPEILQKFARHYKTGEPINGNLVRKMKAADEFGKAISTRQQMFYASLSANYYDRDPKSFEPLTMLKQLQGKYSYYPYMEGTHFHHSFGHLDGYSAMYYTYMWSLSLAKDMLVPFKSAGLMNKQVARRYRDIILKQGGSKDASDLVAEFLGRPFKFDAFEAWLEKDPMTFTAK